MTLSDLNSATDAYKKTSKLPVLFVGHGNPMNALYDNSFTQSLNNVGAELKKDFQINAILVVSAHWLTNGTYVNIQETPEIIYDFSGFPDDLYKVKYPVAGSPKFAEETAKLSSNILTSSDWGIDHGSWTILKHIFPQADVPVFQLSIDYYKPLQYHFDLARQLKSLREKGVLIVGSGNIVHNLRLSFQSVRTHGEEYVLDWAKDFDAWIKNKIDLREFNSVINYESSGEMGKLSVPTVDHYVPMIYSLALSDKNESIIYIHEEVTFGAMSMRCFRIG